MGLVTAIEVTVWPCTRNVSSASSNSSIRRAWSLRRKQSCPVTRWHSVTAVVATPPGPAPALTTVDHPLWLRWAWGRPLPASATLLGLVVLGLVVLGQAPTARDLLGATLVTVDIAPHRER
jgi:hypothetical protein